MILQRLFYGIAFTWNCLSVTSLKDDTNGGVRIFKESSPNELEYVLKRHQGGGGMIQETPVEPDSKERRSSSMGSSFIRFGRGEGTNLENLADTDSKVNRYPRWKSPDIVIRFGRADLKAILDSRSNYKRGRSDLNFIRFGRNDVCASEDPYKVRICNILNEELRNRMDD